MSRASKYARMVKEANHVKPGTFTESGRADWTAAVSESGELILAPRLTYMTAADVQRFIAWLHNAFDEEPF